MNKIKNKIIEISLACASMFVFLYEGFMESEANLVLFLEFLQLSIQLNLLYKNLVDTLWSEAFIKLNHISFWTNKFF